MQQNNKNFLQPLKIKKEHFSNFDGSFTIYRMTDIKFKFSKHIYDIINSYNNFIELCSANMKLNDFAVYNIEFEKNIKRIVNENDLNKISKEIILLALNPYEFFIKKIKYENKNNTDYVFLKSNIINSIYLLNIFQYELVTKLVGNSNSYQISFFKNPNIKMLWSDNVINNLYFDIIYIYKILLKDTSLFLEKIVKKINELSIFKNVNSYTVLYKDNDFYVEIINYLNVLKSYAKSISNLIISIETQNLINQDSKLEQFKIENFCKFISSNADIDNVEKLIFFINNNNIVDIRNFINYELIPEFLLKKPIIHSNKPIYIWILMLRICSKCVDNINSLTKYVNGVLKKFDYNDLNPININFSNFNTHYLVNNEKYKNNNSLFTKILNMNLKYNNFISKTLQNIGFPLKKNIVNYKIESIKNVDYFDIYEYQSLKFYILFDEGDNLLFNIHDIINNYNTSPYKFDIIKLNSYLIMIDASILLNFILQIFLGLLSMMVIFKISNEKDIIFNYFTARKTDEKSYNYFNINLMPNEDINVNVSTNYKLNFFYYGMIKLQPYEKEELKKEFYEKKRDKFWNDRIIQIFTMILSMTNKLLIYNNIFYNKIRLDINFIDIFYKNVNNNKDYLLLTNLFKYMFSVLDKVTINEYNLEEFYSFLYENNLSKVNNDNKNYLLQFLSDYYPQNIQKVIYNNNIYSNFYQILPY